MFQKNPGILLVLALSFPMLQAAKLFDFQAKDLHNRTVSYSEIKGEKVTVIDFWATWCKPCVRSVPRLVALYEKYRSKGVQFIGINVDGPRNLPKVRLVARSLKMTYPVLIDLNNQIMNELNITATPYLLVVDRNDEIVYAHQGYRPGDEKILEEEIKILLNSSGKQPDGK